MGVKFSVFCKKSHSHTYIHYFSHHAPHVKKGVLSGLFLRALRVSSSEFLSSELEILRTAFRRLGYPHFFIRGALSAAKTKFYSSPPTPIASTSHAVTPTRSTTNNSRAKVVVLPFQADFAKCNRFVQDSNIKIVFSSSNSIGRSVVDKKGNVQKSTRRPSGVYTIPCTSPGCNQPYFGRTMEDLHVRTNRHSDDIKFGYHNSALVKHIQSHPGHGFEPASARLIWKTRDKYESQFVEASCIKKFSSCNVSAGEISVSAATASITTRLAKLHKPLNNIPRSQHRSPLYVPRSSTTHNNKRSPLQLPTTSSEPPPTQTIPTQVTATLPCSPAPLCSSTVRTLSVGTQPPDPGDSLQLPTASSEPPAPTTLCSPPTHTGPALLARDKSSSSTSLDPGSSLQLPTTSSEPLAPTVLCSPAHTGSAPLASDKSSSSASASQPLPCSTQLFSPSLSTLPATQVFLRGHHCSQAPSFSPRRLRSDTSKKIFRSIRY